MTLTEMTLDRRATERDIKCLDNIVRNLETFIERSHGEDRSAFKTDLLKYRALHSTAVELLARIVHAIDTFIP